MRWGGCCRCRRLQRAHEARTGEVATDEHQRDSERRNEADGDRAAGRDAQGKGVPLLALAPVFGVATFA